MLGLREGVSFLKPARGHGPVLWAGLTEAWPVGEGRYARAWVGASLRHLSWFTHRPGTAMARRIHRCPGSAMMFRPAVTIAT